MFASNASGSLLFDLSLRHSLYSKLLRIFTYCLRFLENNRVKNFITRIQDISRQLCPLPTAEIARIKKAIITATQRAQFRNEMESLTKGNYLDKCNPFVSLNSFIDEYDEHLRISGHLSDAQLPFDQEHPAILSISRSLIIYTCFKTYAN